MSPFQGFEFDESVARTEPGRPHVPEGYYLLEAVKVDPTPEDYEKTPGVLLSARFVEGPDHAPGAGVGREIRDYSALGGKKGSDGRGSQFGLGQMLGAFGMANVAKKLPGMKIDSYAAFVNFCDALTKQLASRRACGLVADQTGGNTGRPFSGIVEWLPAEEWPQLKRSVLSPMAGPRVGTPAAAATNGAPAATAKATEELRSEMEAIFNS